MLKRGALRFREGQQLSVLVAAVQEAAIQLGSASVIREVEVRAFRDHSRPGGPTVYDLVVTVEDGR